MRELSKQETKIVSGGLTGTSSPVSPSSISTSVNEIQFYIEQPIIVPPLNIVEDFFKHNTDS
jgi:hypothetical protein